jgi:predicted transglutaminase-like cysteine proteinase
MLNTIKKNTIYILFGLLSSGFTFTTSEAAQPVRMAAATSMTVEGASKAPIGWVDFCKTNAADCDVAPAKAARMRMTPARYAELDRINRLVNIAVEPVTDQELFGVEEKWTYPVSGKGDCEDYVLEKRRQLIAAGWPRQALLITVVRDLKGDGHAILSVVTDKGDYALDNQADDVKAWFDTGYTFIKRQSQLNPNQWVLLGDGINPAGVATAP